MVSHVCGKTRDCTQWLVEIACRSLTIDNSTLRYWSADTCTTLYTLQRLICLARSETGIQFITLNLAMPTCDLEGRSRTNLFYFVRFIFFAGKVSEVFMLHFTHSGVTEMAICTINSKCQNMSWAVCSSGSLDGTWIVSASTKTRRLPNVGLMLGQCRRRWANVIPILGQRYIPLLHGSVVTWEWFIIRWLQV